MENKKTRCILETEMILLIITGRIMLWIELLLMSRCLVTELKMPTVVVIACLEDRVQCFTFVVGWLMLICIFHLSFTPFSWLCILFVYRETLCPLFWLTLFFYLRPINTPLVLVCNCTDSKIASSTIFDQFHFNQLESCISSTEVFNNLSSDGSK